MSQWNLGRLRWIAGFLGAAALAGCVVEVTPDPDDGGDGSSLVLTVRIVNTSNVTLDPQIYISATPVSSDELFADANRFTRFGVGTLGLIGGADSDTFTIECSSARVIGTKGGAFGDDLTAPQGFGQQIVLTQELSVFCEGTLTLTFNGAGSTFTTNYTVAR